jgi:DMSO/TMAO reductase YedYZ molybdopterin-dependent catalytic subunit
MSDADHPHDPLRPHAHDPNFSPPSDDPAFDCFLPDGSLRRWDLAALRALPALTIPNCYIVSTGHGTSGPFAFTGALLRDLVRATLALGAPWSQLEVRSADGFGTRVGAAELNDPALTRPILLAYAVDGRTLTRAEGLVRLIVPSESDDALRQVKWVGSITIRR